MSRYIDADDIEIAKFQEENLRGMGEHIAYRIGWNEAIESILENASTIEIIRCRECKLGGTEDCPMDEIDDEYFCNFGEREGE